MRMTRWRNGPYTDALNRFLSSKKYETRRAYIPAITQFFDTFGWISPKDITIDHARSFKATLLSRGKKETTTLWRIAAMSSFMKYLQREGLVESNPFKELDRDDINPEAYRVEQKYSMSEVLNVLKNEPHDIKGLRNRAIRILVLLTKCNREEISNLHVKDIRDDSITLRRREQSRTTELPQEARIAIEEYWRASGRILREDDGVFTPMNRDTPLCESALRLILRRTSVRATKRMKKPRIESRYADLPEVPMTYTALPKVVPDRDIVDAYVRLEEISVDL